MIGSTGVAQRPRVLPVRRRSRSRFALGVFAMLASAGIALVSVTDPYAGAKAAAFYRQPTLVKATGVQRYAIDGGYVLVDLKRDTYTVVQEKPASKPAAAEGSASSSGGGGGYTTPVGVAQTFAAKRVAARGWAPSEFTCLVSLWNRESGWSTHAANPSGAYGIPQALPGVKMASVGSDWRDNAETQITWGLGYIAALYGSPCGAWAHSNAAGWY